MASAWELSLAIEIREDTPEAIVDLLNIMVHETGEKYHTLVEVEYSQFELPKHPFFGFATEWYGFLGNASAYFPGIPFSDLSFGEYTKTYHLTIRTIRRKGDGIHSFLHWIAPYSETTGIVGHMRCDETPAYFYLIWFEDGKAYLQEIKVNEVQPSKREEIVMR